MGAWYRTALAALAAVWLSGCEDESVITGDFILKNLHRSTESPAFVKASFRLVTNDEAQSPVPRLTAMNFRFLDDNEPVSTDESQPRVTNPRTAFTFKTLILFDVSGSVTARKDRFFQMVDSGRVLALRVAEQSDVAIAVFDGRDDIEIVHAFGNNAGITESFAQLGIGIGQDASTNLHGALTHALGRLDEERSRFRSMIASADDENLFGGALIAFTDGTHRAGVGGDIPSRDEVLTQVRDSDHAVFMIGVEGESDPSFIQEAGKDGFALASSTDGALLLGPAFDEIFTSFDAISNSYYQVVYCSPRRAGRSLFRLEINDETGRQGSLEFEYTAGDFSGGCLREIDVRYPEGG